MTDTGDFLMVYDTAVIGIQTGIFLTLASVMLLATKGREKFTARIHLFAGLLCLVLALEFSLPLFYIKTYADFFYNGIVTESIEKHLAIIRQIDFLASYPLLVMFLFSLYQAYRPVPYRKILIPLVIPAALIVWSAADFDRNRQLLICNIFWIAYVLFFILSFTLKLKGYIRYCKDNYSDISSRSLKWLTGIPVLLIPVLALNLYVYSCQASNGILLLISELSLLPATIYIVRYAHKQVPTIEDSTETEPAKSDANVTVQPDADMFDNFSRQLKEKCDKEKIFLNPDLTRTELAKILNTNTTYISRYFSSIGTNFNEYVNGLRIEYALRLIQEADQPESLQMSSLSLASGFSNYRTFARLFREKFGVSPTAWCKKHRF